MMRQTAGFWSVLLCLACMWHSAPHVGAADMCDSSTAVITKYSTSSGLPSKYPRALTRTPAGRIIACFMSETGGNQWLGASELDPVSGTSTMLPTQGLPSLHVRQFHVSSAYLLAATERGLHRYDGKAWQAIGPHVSWQRITLADDGTIWVAGIDDRGCLVAGRKHDSPLQIYSCREHGRDILGLFPIATEAALVFTGTGMYLASQNTLREVNLQNTPIWAPSSHEVERRAPPVYLYDVCRTGSNDLLLIGFFKKLVRFTPDLQALKRSATGRKPPPVPTKFFEVVSEGHFQAVETSTGQSPIVVSDFAGVLSYLSGNKLVSWKSFSPARLGNTLVDQLGRIWVEVCPHGLPHELHLYQKPGDLLPKRVWSLGNTDGFLSPGLITLCADPAEVANPGLWAATNEGIWHFVP